MNKLDHQILQTRSVKRSLYMFYLVSDVVEQWVYRIKVRASRRKIQPLNSVLLLHLLHYFVILLSIKWVVVDAVSVGHQNKALLWRHSTFKNGLFDNIKSLLQKQAEVFPIIEPFFFEAEVHYMLAADGDDHWVETFRILSILVIWLDSTVEGRRAKDQLVDVYDELVGLVENLMSNVTVFTTNLAEHRIHFLNRATFTVLIWVAKLS